MKEHTNSNRFATKVNPRYAARKLENIKGIPGTDRNYVLKNMTSKKDHKMGKKSKRRTHDPSSKAARKEEGVNVKFSTKKKPTYTETQDLKKMLSNNCAIKVSIISIVKCRCTPLER